MYGMEENANLTPDELLHGKWFIQYKKTTGGIDAAQLDLSNMKAIKAPSGEFYADPFAIQINDEYQVFFEKFDYKKGSIATFTIAENDAISEVTDVNIGVNVHLSFPNLFIHGSNFQGYMIPESCHLNQVNLYECVSFPSKWTLCKTLIPNVHSGDNQLLFKDGLWWIFNMIYHNNQNHFCAWYSDDLLGDFIPHPKLNVHNANIKNNDITRGAGNIFTDKYGRLIRPAQYSHRGINGEGVILYEITKLNTESYEETAINLILPDIVDGIRATHTFSVCDDLILMDGRASRSTDHPFADINIETEIQKINEINFEN